MRGVLLFVRPVTYWGHQRALNLPTLVKTNPRAHTAEEESPRVYINDNMYSKREILVLNALGGAIHMTVGHPEKSFLDRPLWGAIQIPSKLSFGEVKLGSGRVSPKRLTPCDYFLQRICTTPLPTGRFTEIFVWKAPHHTIQETTIISERHRVILL